MSERGGARKRGRLTRSGEFDRVYRDGDSRANRFLVLYTFPRADAAAPEPRLGISVGRKIGGAVVRNKVKRRLREAFWALGDRMPSGHDFVVVARPGVEELVDREGTPGLERSLGELLGGGDDASRGEKPENPEQERLT